MCRRKKLFPSPWRIKKDISKIWETGPSPPKKKKQKINSSSDLTEEENILLLQKN